MNAGIAMLDFAGITTGTHAELADQIRAAISSGKIIVGYGINGQSPVILTADSSGNLTGGGVTISVSTSTVTISGPSSGSVISEIIKISGSKEQTITAGNIQTVAVPLTIPSGYEIIGVGKIVPSGVASVIGLAIRGYQQTANGITVYFSNAGSNTGTATIEVEVIATKIQSPSGAKLTPDEHIKKSKKGE